MELSAQTDKKSKPKDAGPDAGMIRVRVKAFRIKVGKQEAANKGEWLIVSPKELLNPAFRSAVETEAEINTAKGEAAVAEKATGQNERFMALRQAVRDQRDATKRANEAAELAQAEATAAQQGKKLVAGK